MSVSIPAERSSPRPDHIQSPFLTQSQKQKYWLLEEVAPVVTHWEEAEAQEVLYMIQATVSLQGRASQLRWVPEVQPQPIGVTLEKLPHLVT